MPAGEMRRWFARTWMVAVPVAVASCGGHGSSEGLAADLCTRLANCNELGAVTVPDCTREKAKELSYLAEAKRDDCLTAINICLGKRSCDLFLACDLSDCR